MLIAWFLDFLVLVYLRIEDNVTSARSCLLKLPNEARADGLICTLCLTDECHGAAKRRAG